MEGIDQKQRRHVCFVEFTKVAAPGTKSTVANCILFQMENIFFWVWGIASFLDAMPAGEEHLPSPY